jgi:hypothetical protein
LSLLWERLSQSDQEEVGQILAEMIARAMAVQILPSKEKEESHE